MIQNLKLELKSENLKLRQEKDALILKNEQLQYLENKLTSFKLAFSDQATDLMEHIKILNPRYVKNYALLKYNTLLSSPKNVDETQITRFFKDIIQNMNNMNSDLVEDLSKTR